MWAALGHKLEKLNIALKNEFKTLKKSFQEEKSNTGVRIIPIKTDVVQNTLGAGR